MSRKKVNREMDELIEEVGEVEATEEPTVAKAPPVEPVIDKVRIIFTKTNEVRLADNNVRSVVDALNSLGGSRFSIEDDKGMLVIYKHPER